MKSLIYKLFFSFRQIKNINLYIYSTFFNGKDYTSKGIYKNYTAFSVYTLKDFFNIRREREGGRGILEEPN